MYKEYLTARQKKDQTALSGGKQTMTLFDDLRLLFKAPVLIANVLPVFTGFWLALYFTNSSLAESWTLLLLTLFGSIAVIAGALILNNWYDVDIDTVMKRTVKRPTVTGHFSLRFVLWLGILLTVIGFVLLLFTTLEATIYAVVGWVTYVWLYTMWSKRKYTLNTVIGSISGAVTPLIGWTAIAPGYHVVPIVCALILFIWQMPHTFVIAMRKSEEYRAAKVAMLPVVRGFDMTKRQIALYVACLMPLPFLMGTLGMTFIVIATLLNIGFLVISLQGFKTKDDMKWSTVMFLYSVNYIAILFTLMIVLTWSVVKN
ncbi:heme o synthase [Sporosarcina sp. HYO08]|uniref:heme o synthase n=1 Tax=Sporosarcina sp. HYO08 TaxID=1759557 RepID=UPI0007917F0B|nr:heme o synthase [Sporosarcina sp. HYO08]KXH81866.1 protoheme IX farnesyltransferase [Sporosarcina sp. HYO08]